MTYLSCTLTLIISIVCGAGLLVACSGTTLLNAIVPRSGYSVHKDVAYGDCAAGILVSVFPVCLWLFPVLAQADKQFAFWLLWEQTAGRVTGNFNEAHIRPFYFYLPLLPIMFAPWVFFPSFWRALKAIDRSYFGIRFVICWILPVTLSFSLISGKQPHYLLPLLPGVILLVQSMMQQVSAKTIQRVALSMVAVIIVGQGAAALVFFPKYDLRPVSACVQKNTHLPWAFVGTYHGEIGFLSRRETPVADLSRNQIESWFAENPNGWAVIRYKSEQDVTAYNKIFSQSYRGRKLGIFTHADNPVSETACL